MEAIAPGLTWSSPSAALGAVYALPAAATVFLDVRFGVALAVGVLPAAIAGLPPTRRARLAVLVLGVVTAISMLIGGALAGVPVLAAAATHASRWYVTATFTTFLVFLLLLFADPDTAGSRFGERVGETLLGVGLAYAFGLALPAAHTARRPRVEKR